MDYVTQFLMFCFDCLYYAGPIAVPVVVFSFMIFEIRKAKREGRSFWRGNAGPRYRHTGGSFDANGADAPAGAGRNYRGISSSAELAGAAYAGSGHHDSYGGAGFSSWRSDDHSSGYSGGHGSNTDGTPMLGGGIDTNGHAFGASHEW